MKIFILEDDPGRVSQFIENSGNADVDVANTVELGMKIWNPPYDLVLLDHDLGGEQPVKSTYKRTATERDYMSDNTGYDFVKWLVKHGNPKTDYIVVHSYNPDGAGNMLALLFKHQFKAMREPFGPRLLEFVRKLTHDEVI